MREFKFACPVCGQHLTADASHSGEQTDCPTCFRKLVVPTAPASQNSGLILSAALADDIRTSHADVLARLAATRGRALTRWSLLLGLGVVLTLAALVVWWALERYAGRSAEVAPLAAPAPPMEKRVFSFWTADFAQAVLPETPLSGKVRGVVVDHCIATLEGGTLTLRATNHHQGALKIGLYARQPRDLAGRSFTISRERPSPRPRIELSWIDSQQSTQQVVFETGYVLKMSFGQTQNGDLPGELYLSLPDDYRSFIAGRFVAAIRGAENH